MNNRRVQEFKFKVNPREVMRWLVGQKWPISRVGLGVIFGSPWEESGEGNDEWKTTLDLAVKITDQGLDQTVGEAAVSFIQEVQQETGKLPGSFQIRVIGNSITIERPSGKVIKTLKKQEEETQ